MVNPGSTPIDGDFREVVDFLKSVRVFPSSPSDDMISLARKIHEQTYSLILWKFRLKRLSPHAKPFIEEIASDALQILPQIMLGFGKTAKLLVRGVLENTMRNIYYADHAVEFTLLNQEKKSYIEVKSLVEYLKTHPLFSRTEPSYDAVNKLYSLYSELSAGIHGRRVSDLEMRAALRAISYTADAAKKESETVSKCAASTNFLLAAFYRNQFNSFSADDRKIILRTLPRSAKTTLGALDVADP